MKRFSNTKQTEGITKLNATVFTIERRHYETVWTPEKKSLRDRRRAECKHHGDNLLRISQRLIARGAIIRSSRSK